MTFNWAKASDVDLCSYALHTFQHFKSIPINCAIKCDDVNCSSPEHRQTIDLFYSQICFALEPSSQKTIPSSNLRDGLDYIVPGSMILSKNYILLLAMIILSGGMLVGPDQVLFVVI